MICCMDSSVLSTTFLKMCTLQAVNGLFCVLIRSMHHTPSTTTPAVVRLAEEMLPQQVCIISVKIGHHERKMSGSKRKKKVTSQEKYFLRSIIS